MIASEKEKQERLDKCSLCPNYRKDFTYLWVFKVKDKPQCNICKCHIPTKVIFTDSQCPIKKW